MFKVNNKDTATTSLISFVTDLYLAHLAFHVALITLKSLHVNDRNIIYIFLDCCTIQIYMKMD